MIERAWTWAAEHWPVVAGLSAALGAAGKWMFKTWHLASSAPARAGQVALDMETKLAELRGLHARIDHSAAAGLEELISKMIEAQGDTWKELRDAQAEIRALHRRERSLCEAVARLVQSVRWYIAGEVDGNALLAAAEKAEAVATAEV